MEAIERLARWLYWVLDLKGSDDAPAFTKVVVVTLLVAVLCTSQLSLGWGILFISAAFGRSVFLGFLRSRTVTVNRAEVYAEAFARRDPVEGIEPTA